MGQAGAAVIVGWMLRANRTLGAEPALRTGREFARAFRRDGERPLSPSHVTRWESGQLPAGHGAIRRYEKMLGLNPESLVALSDALVRLDGATTTRFFEQRQSDRRRLHEMFDRALDAGEMTGADWSLLTELVATQPGLVLHPPRLWRQLAGRLLDELVVATYTEWLQRQEAMSRLLEHADACTHAIAACVTMVGDPASPAVIEPLSLLNVTNHPEANRFVLRQIEAPDDERALHGALLAAIQKVSRHHFQAGERIRLAQRLNEYAADPTLGSSLRTLAREAHGRVARRADAGAHPLAERIANGDETLALVISDAVFHPDPDRRMIAGMLIAATPYREPVARAILHEFTQDLARRANNYPASTLRTLTNMKVDFHRPLIHTVLGAPGTDTVMRRAAASALPHCPGADSVQVWRRSLAAQLAAWKREPEGEAILLEITYGIGTDGLTPLLTEICQDPRMPASARTTASWLLKERVAS